MSQENLALVNRGFEALSRGDLDAWIADCTTDMEIHELPEMPDAAVYHGHDGMRRWAGAMTELVEEWQWSVEEVLLDQGDTVVTRTRLSGQGSGGGVPIDIVVFHVFVVRDGQVARIRGFLDRATALEAA